MTSTTQHKAIVLVWAALLATPVGVFGRATRGSERQVPPVIIRDALDKPREPGDDREVLTLANGASLEVVGISPHPSGPATWWNHKGEPLAGAPCDTSPNVMQTDRPSVFLAILVRVKGIPEGAEAGFGIASPAAGSSSKGPAMRGGRVVSGLTLMIAEIPKKAESCTVRFEVADGPWKTIGTTEGTGARGRSSRVGPSYVFGEAIETKDGGTAITATHDIPGQSVRIAAADRDGKEHASVGGGGAGVGKFEQLGAVFDLPPEVFMEYRLQTRSYQQAELKGIALKPRK